MFVSSASIAQWWWIIDFLDFFTKQKNIKNFVLILLSIFFLSFKFCAVLSRKKKKLESYKQQYPSAKLFPWEKNGKQSTCHCILMFLDGEVYRLTRLPLSLVELNRRNPQPCSLISFREFFETKDMFLLFTVLFNFGWQFRCSFRANSLRILNGSAIWMKNDRDSFFGKLLWDFRGNLGHRCLNLRNLHAQSSRW